MVSSPQIRYWSIPLASVSLGGSREVTWSFQMMFNRQLQAHVGVECAASG